MTCVTFILTCSLCFLTHMMAAHYCLPVRPWGYPQWPCDSSRCCECQFTQDLVHCGSDNSTITARQRHRQSWSRVPVCFHMSACAWTLCIHCIPGVSRHRAQGCFSLFLYRCNNFHHPHVGCLCVHHSWSTAQLSKKQLRADIILRSGTVQQPFSARPGVVRGFRLGTYLNTHFHSC